MHVNMHAHAHITPTHKHAYQLPRQKQFQETKRAWFKNLNGYSYLCSYEFGKLLLFYFVT